MKTLYITLPALILIYFTFVSTQVYAQAIPSVQHISKITNGLTAPLQIDVDNDGIVYVTDAVSKKISKFSPSGVLIGELNTGGLPLSITISDNNTIFVGDCAADQVIRINPNGSSTIIYQTIYPSSMVTGNNLLYVADIRQKKIVVMDFDGNFIREIGKGTLLKPTGIAYDPVGNKLLVAEHGGSKGSIFGFKGMGLGGGTVAKIWKFDLQGNLLGSFGAYGKNDGEFYRIQGITVGKCGNIYAIDPYLATISIFDNDGIFLTKMGSFGTGAGQLNVPMDLSFDSQERLVVTSMDNASFEIYNVNPNFPTSNMPNDYSAFCPGGSTSININFTGTAPWNFIYTVNGLNPTTINNINQSPYNLTVSEAGLYQVTKLSDANYTATCYSGGTTIQQNTLPASEISSGDAVICAGETASITVDFVGSAPWLFTYTTDGTNPVTVSNVTKSPYIIKTATTGTYAVSELWGNTCSSTDFVGSATVSVRNLPSSNIPTGDINICSGETANIAVDFTGTAPWSFTYTKNGLNPTTVNTVTQNPYNLTVSQAGLYAISSLSDKNCIGNNLGNTAKVTINTLPTANLTLIGNHALDAGETTTISVALTGTAPWSFSYTDGITPPVNINTNQNPYNFTVSQAKTYHITALTSGNCIGNNLGTALPVYRKSVFNGAGLWEEHTNWSNLAPDLKTNAVVAPGADVTVGTQSILNNCNDLTIQASGKLRILSGKALQIEGQLTIESDASGTGSLLDENTEGNITVKGTTTVKRYLETASRYYYVSSPVTNGTAGTFGSPVELNGPSPTDRKLWKFDSTAWEQITYENTILQPLRGYAFKTPIQPNTTYEFTGTLNTGTKSINLFDNSYTLVGNPYPSALDWGLNSSAGWTSNGVNPTIWYREGGSGGSSGGGNFHVYNRLGGTFTGNGQRYIPAMQAFWVESNTIGATLTVNNNARTHNTQAFYKNEYENCGLRIIVTHSDYKDDALIAFDKNATDKFEAYDSRKMFASGNKYPQIYTEIEDNLLAINTYAPLSDNLSVPLGFKAKESGMFSITAEMLGKLPDDVSVYLEDQETGITHQLLNGENYEFYSNVVNNTSRFIIHFVKLTTAANSVLNREGSVNIYAYNQTVYVDFKEFDSGNITVYNLLGVQIYQDRLQANSLNEFTINCASGYYIVQVESKNNIYVKKTFIK